MGTALEETLRYALGYVGLFLGGTFCPGHNIISAC